MISAKRGRCFVSGKGFFGCLVGWLLLRSGGKPGFGPAAELLFFASPKKSNQKKGEPRPCPSRFLALLAAFGTLANSLRSNNASVLIRTLLRCSARPNGGGIPLGSSASRTSPVGLVRFAHLAGVGLPHSSTLTAHKGTARRATTPSPLTPTTSLLTPTTSLLTPTTSLLTPTPSLLTPTTSLLTPHSSLL